MKNKCQCDHKGCCTSADLLEQLKKAVECLYGLNKFDLDPMKQAITKAEAQGH